MNHGELNQLLLGRIEEVCNYLLPQGTKKGNTWEFGDIHGGAGKSGGVVLNGSKAGCWSDWADDKLRGRSLVSLWCQVRCDDDYGKAADEIKEYLGVKDDDFKISHRPRKIYVRPSEQDRMEVAPVDARSATLKYLEDDRGLSLDLLHRYKICARQDDTGYIFCYYSGAESSTENIAMFKHVFLQRDEKGKKKTFITKDSEPVLFGKGAIPKNSESVIITAGELDAVSWAFSGHPAVSIPMGIQNTNWLENDFEWLERFETIYINYDSDPKEQDAARALAERLGLERCLNIVLDGYKDANQMLVDGEPSPERFIESAKSMMPEDIVPVGDNIESLLEDMAMREENAPGWNNPWSDKMKFKIRDGEISLVFGFTGQGKTSAMTHMLCNMQAQGARGLVASLEMNLDGLRGNMVRCFLGDMYPQPEQIKYVIQESALSNMFMVNRRRKLMVEAKQILEYFELFAKKYAVDYIILDNMMMCHVGQDDYGAQAMFIESMKEIADRYGIHIFIVAHPRKPPSYEDMLQPPNPYEVKGAGEIANLVENSISVWRNVEKHKKLAEAKSDGAAWGEIADIKEKPDGIIEIFKQRNGIGTHRGWIGQTKVWCKSGMQFHTSIEAEPTNYSM